MLPTPSHAQPLLPPLAPAAHAAPGPQLVLVARSLSDATLLYLDVADGTYWELGYPPGPADAAGPQLQPVRLLDAVRRYPGVAV